MKYKLAKFLLCAVISVKYLSLTLKNAAWISSSLELDPKYSFLYFTSRVLLELPNCSEYHLILYFDLWVKPSKLSFNDYFEPDTSVYSKKIRTDVSNTFDIILLKPLGDFLPILDPNKLINLSLSYDKTVSEANIINFDYEAESIAFGISRSFNLRP